MKKIFQEYRTRGYPYFHEHLSLESLEFSNFLALFPAFRCRFIFFVTTVVSYFFFLKILLGNWPTKIDRLAHVLGLTAVLSNQLVFTGNHHSQPLFGSQIVSGTE